MFWKQDAWFVFQEKTWIKKKKNFLNELIKPFQMELQF